MLSSTIYFQWRKYFSSYHSTNGQSVDFTTIFIFRHRKHPGNFFIGSQCLRTHPTYLFPWRGRSSYAGEIPESLEDVDIGVLYGLSAIGSKLCVYTWTEETSRFLPKPIPIDPKYTIDTSPRSRSDLDLLSTEGEERIRGIVAHIKTMCGQL